MGVGINNGRSTYVNIKKGQLIIKKDDNTIQAWDYIEGRLTGIDIKDDEYQGKKFKKLLLTINDAKEIFQLQLRLDSGYGIAFCNLIPNVDPKQLIKIMPTYKEVDGQGKGGMFISQNGTALKWKWTRDNPGELPPLVPVTFKGETNWDNTDQQAFFMHLLLEVVKPQLVQMDAPPVSNTVSGKSAVDDIMGGIDDLPF